MEINELARGVLGYGWIPIPLKGKRPLPKEWQRVTRDTALETVKKYEKSADNIGILTGIPSGVVVVDVEAKNMKNWNKLVSENTSTYEPVKEWEINRILGFGEREERTPEKVSVNVSKAKTGESPFEETFTVLTGTGGLHYYYKYDDRFRDFINGPIKGIGDFRTTGGQIVMAGSIHPATGKMYQVWEGYPNFIPNVGEMPDWLYQLIKRERQAKR